MLNIVLYEPEIAPNTGNIIRLSSNTGFQLHIIKPMGFEWDDKRLRRAGLDYSEYQPTIFYTNWQAFINDYQTYSKRTLWAITTKGKQQIHHASFSRDDYLLFGPETRGLPNHVLQEINPKNALRIPMRPNNRSLNLSNAVAITTYIAWLQLGFDGSI